MAKDEVQDFLDDLKGESQEDPFEDLPDTTEKQPEKDVKEEKPLSFNKDPKVQRYIEKQVEKLTKDLRPTEVQTFVRDVSPKEEEDEILKSLTEIVGNDTPQKVSAVARLHKALQSDKEEAVRRAVSELQSMSEQQEQEERQEFSEAQNELLQGFESIEDTYGVDLLSDKGKSLRGEFIDFIKRVAPKDEDGEVIQYPDFEETYKLFTDTRKTPSNTRAKDIAARGIARSNDASVVKPAGNSWKDVDKIFSKINN